MPSVPSGVAGGAPSAPEVAPVAVASPAGGADFTDVDLRAALVPLLASSFPDEELLISRLDPLLRATVRRALAEAHSVSQRPFRTPGLWDRLRWRLLALLTSRTYAEVVFEKTRRFQVEEAYLLDPRTLAMISYASNDPARHAHPPRVHGTAKRLALQIGDAGAGTAASFQLPEHRTALTVPGRCCLLVAVARGTANELLLSDLAFCLARVEARFAERLRNPSQPLLAEIQPFLEDCLLIQAPCGC